MFTAYCGHCDKTWKNSDRNCPTCGTPSPGAKQEGATNRARKKTMHQDDLDGDTPSFRKNITEAAKLGAAMAVASEANNVIKTGAHKALVAAGIPELALEGAIFQKGVPLLTAVSILFLAERFPDLIPKSDMVVKAASLALSTATAETIQPLLAMAGPTFAALAASGQKLSEIEGDQGDLDEFEDEGEGEFEDAEFEEAEAGAEDIEIEVKPADEPGARPQAPRVHPHRR